MVAGRGRSLRHLTEAVLATTDDDVIACDANRRIRYVNRAARELHGLTQLDELEPLMRSACESGRVRRLDGTALDLEELPLSRALITGDTVRDQFILELPDGKELVKSGTAVPLREGGRVVGAVVVGRDVTELMQLDRLKDQFLAAAAHELKTPLAIIKGGAHTLARHEQADEAVRGSLARICRGADRIDHVVTELLDTSQLQLGRLVVHREPVDLRELVELAIERAARLAPRRRLLLGGGVAVPVFADPLRISQVLANLLSNAIDYSPDGGDVEIEVSHSAGEAVVSVCDHGIGIPRDRQNRIFKRFYRAHADTPYDRGGVGLGLYLSKELVASHGGRIWFESDEGVGSTFSFSLPC